MAIENGNQINIEKLKELQDEIHNINVQNEHGKTQLHLAVENEDQNKITTLLKRGINCFIKDNNGKDPLDLAIEEGYKEIAEILASYPFKLSVNTLLHYAALCGDTGVLNTSLQCGADINHVNDYGETALYIAICNGHINVVEKLISIQGINTEVTLLCNHGAYYGKFTSLHIAAREGNLDIMKLLISKQVCDVNSKVVYERKSEDYLLGPAASNSKRPVKWKSKIIEDHLSNYCYLNDVKPSPLALAAQRGHLEVVKILTIGDNYWKIENPQSFSLSISLAVKNGHMEVMKFLVRNKRFKGEYDNLHSYYYTLLKSVAEKGETDNLKFLIEEALSSEDLKKKLECIFKCIFTGSSSDPLTLAMINGHLDTANFIITSYIKDNINLLKKYAFSAIVKYRKDIFTFLMSFIESENDLTQYALQCARAGNIDIINFLKTRGLEITNCIAKTIFNIAVEFNRKNLVELLLKDYNGFDLNIALYRALDRGSADTAKLLLDQDGVDVNFEYARDITPLILAVRNTLGLEVEESEYIAILKILLDKGANVLVGKNGGTILHEMVTSILQITDGNRKGKIMDSFMNLLKEANIDIQAIVNTQDNDGKTPLLLALQSKLSQIEIVTNLIKKYKADINIKDKEDYSTLDYSMRHGEKDAVLKLLIDQADLKVSINPSIAIKDIPRVFKALNANIQGEGNIDKKSITNSLKGILKQKLLIKISVVESLKKVNCIDNSKLEQKIGEVDKMLNNKIKTFYTSFYSYIKEKVDGNLYNSLEEKFEDINRLNLAAKKLSSNTSNISEEGLDSTSSNIAKEMKDIKDALTLSYISYSSYVENRVDNKTYNNLEEKLNDLIQLHEIAKKLENKLSNSVEENTKEAWELRQELKKGLEDIEKGLEYESCHSYLKNKINRNAYRENTKEKVDDLNQLTLFKEKILSKDIMLNSLSEDISNGSNAIIC